MSDDAGLAAHADWYRTFFRGLALDLWRAVVPPELTRAEADYLVRELGLRAGARVLDVPCGDGRHALELAARGLRVTGVDLSPGQISAARERGAQAGAAVEWRLADMRDLPWSAAFDGACCMGNSFGYIEPAACEDFLRAVARALRPGARFVLDTGMVAEALLPRLVAHEEVQVGDILFVQDNRYVPAARCIETVYTMTRRGSAAADGPAVGLDATRVARAAGALRAAAAGGARVDRGRAVDGGRALAAAGGGTHGSGCGALTERVAATSRRARQC